MNKYLKWGIVAAITAGSCVYGYYQLAPHLNKELSSAENAKTGNKKKSLSVTARIIEPTTLTDEIITPGILVPHEEVQLTFETSGKVTGIYFEEGTFVKKGTLLAKVNDSHLQAELSRLKAQIPLAEERVNRQKALLQRDAVSKEALEIVNTELATLKAEIEQKYAQIKMTELRAPFDGTIGLRQISIGAYASPSTIVASLTSVSPLKVEFSVAERYAQDVKKGTKLTFNANGFLEPFEAEVYATESRVDSETHSLTARALYPNKENKLLPGVYAGIRLKRQEINNAISIPAEAIVPEMGKNKVFVYRSGKAEPVEVKIGLRTEAEVQITQGLQIGDTILTSGTLQLRNGTAVKITGFE
jgi:membrane fusion protein (multidrug efflux system)